MVSMGGNLQHCFQRHQTHYIKRLSDFSCLICGGMLRMPGPC